MSPPRLIAAIAEVAEAADALDKALALEFGGRLIAPQLRRGKVLDASALGAPRRLRNLRAIEQPVALAPGNSVPHAGDDSAISATGMMRFLNVMREAQQVVLGLSMMSGAPVPGEPALHVALALRATYAAGPALDAARQLLHEALALRSDHTLVSRMRSRYARVIANRGHCTAQPPVAWPRIAAHQVKRQLAEWLAVAAKFKLTAPRRTVLLGGLCELALFSDVAPSVIARLQGLIDSSQADDTESVDALQRTLEGISR
jgi:hypothetical protein